ncbi:hypothetical protein ACWDUG_16615, partial [Streptomyces cellulosae]
RSMRTSRSAGVRPEATSSARTWTTLPKPWAAGLAAAAVALLLRAPFLLVVAAAVLVTAGVRALGG